MSIKVRTQADSGSVADISLLIETSDRYVDWNNEELAASIVEETGINLEVASEITVQVREKIQDLADNLGWTSISTRLIREVVEQELLQKGRRYKNRAKRYRTLGLSEREITNVIENTGSRDNGNLGHNPDSILFVSSETMVKQYALKHVFSPDVVDAHLLGDISLHDLGGVFKVYAFSKFTHIPLRIEGKEITMTLDEIWTLLRGEETTSDGVVVKVPEHPVEVRDGSKWVPLLRLIRHNEVKEMREFILEGGGLVGVSADHACLVQRGEKTILVRADEVRADDRFLQEANN